MISCRQHLAVAGVLLVYLALALPLPFVLLDHDLGLLSGSAAHTALDDHAWLDHAAGAGLASDGVGIMSSDLAARFEAVCDALRISQPITVPSVRGPPPSLQF